MKNIEHLETESLGKLLIKFSVPAIVGMIANASYNIVDRIFVGRGVGTNAISGIMITFPIVILILAFAMLIGIGSTALVSIRLGEKNKGDAEKILGNAITLSLIIGLSITLIGYLFMHPILSFLGGSGETLSYSVEYMQVVLIGVVFQLLAFSLNNIIRGEGNPRIAMFTMIIGAVINIILDAFFIFVLKLGVSGAALATVIGQIVSSAWVLYYFLGKKSLLRFSLKNTILDMRIIKGVFGIGVSPFAMQIAGSIIIILFNNQLLIYGGDVAIAVMGIIQSVLMVILMPIFGLNQGIQPIIGYNYGAGKFDRVKKVLKLGIVSSTAICVVGFIIFELFAEHTVAMFSKTDPALLKMGTHALRVYMIMMPVIGYQIITAAYFQAVGKPIKAMILTISRQVLIIIPLLFILPPIFKLEGLWLAGPVSDGLSALIATVLILNELKSLGNKSEPKTVLNEA